MIDIFNLSLNDITPENLKQDPQISSLIAALDPELKELSQLSLEPLILARIDELPEDIIDLLAWQLHADFYDLAGTLDMKRRAVKGSILWHMHKGTEWAILEALRMIDISAEFVPWYEDNSAPYTFKLKAIVSGDFYRTQGRDRLISSIRRAVNEAKSARSYLAGLETQIYFHEDAGIHAGVIPVLSGEKRFLLPPPEIKQPAEISTALYGIHSGSEIIRAHREQNFTQKIYAGVPVIHNRDYDLGVNLDIMQELLRQFEARIMSRIDAYEQRTIDMITRNQEITNAKLDDIREMLRWKGDDEDL